MMSLRFIAVLGPFIRQDADRAHACSAKKGST